MDKKNCLHCDALMLRPRWKNGKLDATFKGRKFCSLNCYGAFVESLGLAKHKSGRKNAQRRVKMNECNRCHATARLQRHHIDRNPKNNDLSNIEVLCQICHKQEHLTD